MMQIIINTPLGKAKIEGNNDGISSVTILNDDIKESQTIRPLFYDNPRLCYNLYTL